MSDSFFTCVLMENYADSVPFVGLKGDFVSSSILLTQLPILASPQINWAQKLLVRELYSMLCDSSGLARKKH